MQFIEAKDKSLAEVLSNNRYRIDSFQREYRWQRKQIEALISDLSICFDKNYKNGDTIESYNNYNGYYMGPIVLCDDKKSLSIIDGQQRLTSFTLLLIFLHHAQAKFDLPENLYKDLKQYLYVTKGGKTTLILNVDSRTNVIEHLYKKPDTIFVDIEEFEEAEYDIKENKKKIQDESIENIIGRYEDITKLFPEEINTAQKLPIFIEWLLDKVYMVDVKAFDMENAYTIFETMNDRGLSLNPTEILKGYLLSKIEDEKKSDEMNEFWKDRISEIKSQTGIDGDLDFFRAWLRAKYAETKRLTKQGAENEDFEIIGTQFHSWIKNNSNKTFLKNSDDYYFFIRSDFDFYSNLYKQLFTYKTKRTDGFELMYISNFYPIADSLSYPLLISPISKIDESLIIEDKIKLVAKFIDIYTNNRAILSKAITQSSIRSYFYDLIKDVRNLDFKLLKTKLSEELKASYNNPFPSFSILHKMDNWGYYHYFFARIIQHLNNDLKDFNSLLRSRKQNSLVLFKILTDEDKSDYIYESLTDLQVNSVANFCLVRRFELEKLSSMEPLFRFKYLLKEGYMPEMGFDETNIDSISEFITQRDNKIRELVDEIWSL